jgi:hypothetical protein
MSTTSNDDPADRVYSKQQLLDVFAAGAVAEIPLNFAEVRTCSCALACARARARELLACAALDAPRALRSAVTEGIRAAGGLAYSRHASRARAASSRSRPPRSSRPVRARRPRRGGQLWFLSAQRPSRFRLSRRPSRSCARAGSIRHCLLETPRAASAAGHVASEPDAVWAHPEAGTYSQASRWRLAAARATWAAQEAPAARATVEAACTPSPCPARPQELAGGLALGAGTQRKGLAPTIRALTRADGSRPALAAALPAVRKQLRRSAEAWLVLRRAWHRHRARSSGCTGTRRDRSRVRTVRNQWLSG